MKSCLVLKTEDLTIEVDKFIIITSFGTVGIAFALADWAEQREGAMSMKREAQAQLYTCKHAPDLTARS